MPRLFLDKSITTGLFSGYSPVAPGTMGAILATAMWIAASCFVTLDLMFFITMWLSVLTTLLSIQPIDRLEKIWGEDPSRVVVDEMVGVWICLLAVPADVEPFGARYWIFVALALALFRLFDIWKPLGVRKMESLGGGWGVMMDDVLAGIYGAVVMVTLRFCGV